MEKNKFVMVVGIPASGKSTLTEQYKEDGYKIHSSDQLRIELHGDLNGKNATANIFDELHKRIITDLKNGESVVYDATNLVSKRRRGFLQQIKKIDCEKVAVVVATPYNDCIDRDRKREKKVGSEVIERMYKSFQIPCKQEGFDRVDIVYNVEEDFYLSLADQLQFLQTVNQNNSNHTMTIGNHCRAVSNALIHSETLRYAGLLHDFGKLFTASFKDNHGRVSNQCHYYSHESVSAYDSMFYHMDRPMEDILESALLINYHMLPHTLKEDKTIEKYKSFLGEEFWNKLMLLHEADKGAR